MNWPLFITIMLCSMLVGYIGAFYVERIRLERKKADEFRNRLNGVK